MIIRDVKCERVIIGLDTALKNMGFVALKDPKTILESTKPFLEAEDLPGEALFNRHRRHVELYDWVTRKIEEYTLHQLCPVFVAFEDYYISPRQQNFKQAEFHGMLKLFLWKNRIPYTVIANAKRTKYMEKRRMTSAEAKKLAREWADRVAPAVNAPFKRQADKNDVSDAYLLACIGDMVFEAGHTSSPIEYTKNSNWESRWKEILTNRDQTGLLDKPGLVELF